MATILTGDFGSNGRANTRSDSYLNAASLAITRRQINQNLIAPADEDVEYEIANEHTSEPVKSLDDIRRISNYFIENERYRDNMLFIVGINFGLRISDLLQLRFSHLINDADKDGNITFKLTFPILEKKTKNTRKVKRNRYITINDATMDAVILYLQHNKCKLSDYMFRSESNRGSNQNKPMSRMTADRVLKEVGTALGLEIKIATHTLRKTFAYHQMVMSNNDPRKLLLLQKMFGHSSAAQTLDYIGITGEEIEEAYLKLNLGKGDAYLQNFTIGEALPIVS